MCELYEVDPDGDLLLILPSPEEAFAPWNEPEDVETLPDLPESGPGVGIISSPSATDEGDLPVSYTSPSSFHLKVSSKHLILASHRFKKMLTGNWVEANLVYEDGCRHVTLEGFDPTALKLLLDIIHGKTRKVPRSLDLEMLAKVSVIVDDLECHEEVEVFSEIWLKHLPKSPPTEYNRDLVLWILISFVFRQSSEFESATRTAILRSAGPIQTLGLPLRSIIVDEIDRQRQDLFDRLIQTLHDFLDKLRKDQPWCSFECDSILLGAFIKQMEPHNLIWPWPSMPFIGFNFFETADVVRRFQSPVWCAANRTAEPPADAERFEEEWSSFNKKKKKGKAQTLNTVEEVRNCPQYKRCTFEMTLNPAIDCLVKRVKGLDL